jgi:hypothetical protein
MTYCTNGRFERAYPYIKRMVYYHLAEQFGVEKAKEECEGVICERLIKDAWRGSDDIVSMGASSL